MSGEGRVNRPDRMTRNKRRYNKLIGKTEWFKEEKEEGKGAVGGGKKKRQ